MPRADVTSLLSHSSSSPKRQQLCSGQMEKRGAVGDSDDKDDVKMGCGGARGPVGS